MSDEDVDDELDEVEDESEEGFEGEEESGGRSFGWKKILLFAGLPALLLIGGVTGAFFAGVFDSLTGDEQQEAEASAMQAVGSVVMYDLPEMLVNLSSGSGGNYLKINVALEIEDPTIAPQLDALVPSIVEGFQLYLRELQLEELDGSGGLYRIKEELLVRVIAATQPLKIKDVLFKEMSVQ